jgi:acetyltransferase-like isoleucine patch superfamily enzyme
MPSPLSVLSRIEAAIRRLRLRWTGVRYSGKVHVSKSVRCSLGRANGRSGSISIGDACTLLQGAVLSAWGGSIRIGRNVFVGEYAVVYGHGGVTIGDDSLIAMHCKIVSSNHTVPDRGSRIRHCHDILKPTEIGADVWLGAGVTVLGGVTIGNGCVVAAGSVVTKDLPPYSIAMGVPARVVRSRE